jgi:hypothetical protein
MHLRASSRDYRQDEVRRMFGIMQDRLSSLQQLGVTSKRLAAVGISVESWEVTAGYLDADAMAAPEEVAGYPKIYLVPPNIARRQQRGFIHPGPPTRANNAVA